MSIEIGTVFGRYEIRARIGAGGMGEVYRAEDRVLQRAVAIKFIDKRKHPSETAAKRFLREARAASRLNHPNIIVIHEIIETGEHAYIVMEFVSGKSLREHIRSQSFTADVLLDLASQLADALGEAHSHGIIHRDIKPENIIVNERGHAKLLDFGLARDIERERPLADEAALTAAAVETLTGASAVVGTIPYMSPEQLRKEPLDARTDIFSYGIVLHEMLTGRHPFWATSSFEIAAAILGRAAVDPPALDPSFPAGTSALLSRLLEKERERRPASFAEVREALAALKHELRLRQSAASGRPPTQNLSPARPAQEFAGAETALATSQPPDSPSASHHSAAGGPTPTALSGANLTAQGSQSFPAIHPSAHHAFGPAAGPRTVLVLPFEAVGSQEDNSFIGIGLASVITTDLAKVSGISVLSKAAGAGRAHQTGRGAQELARELGASILLEGEVMRAGQMIRITARLTDVETGRVIWGDRYRGDESELFDMQDSVCKSVADALKVSLSSEVREEMAQPPTTNINAFELYSKARAFLERREIKGNVDFATRMFEEALKLDPQFAAAQAGLGEAYWLKYDETRDGLWVQRALSASDRALVLDPNQPQVHVSLGIIYQGTGKLDRAVEEFERALSLQPLSDDAYRWLGRCFMQKGELERAISHFRKAIEIRPGYWDNYDRLGVCYYLLGRYEEAAEQFRQVIAIQPDSYKGYNNLGGIYYLLGRYEDAIPMHRRANEIHPTADAYSNLGSNYFYLERYSEAIDAYRSAVELNPGDDISYRNLGDAYLRAGSRADAEAQYKLASELLEKYLNVAPGDAELLGRLAVCQAKLGRTGEAVSNIERATGREPHNTKLQYQKAVVYALSGLGEQALQYLGHALSHGYSPSEARRDPDLLSLRGSAGFDSLLPPAG